MDTKEHLLDHALSLFAQRGVDAVGVQEICDSAGVTKPTLYHHWGNKEGLVQGLVDRGFRTLADRLASLGSYDRDLPRYLERDAELWLDVVRLQPDWFRVILSLSVLGPEHALSPLVRPGLEARQQQLERLFIEAAVQHGNMRGRHRLLAAGWQGSLNHWTGIYLGAWALTDSAFVRAGTRQFLYGIFS